MRFHEVRERAAVAATPTPTAQQRSRTHTLVLLLCCGFLLGLPACGDSSDGDGDGEPVVLSPNPQLTIGSEFQRSARVVLPADYDIAERYPLVILLHGFGATGDAQDFIFRLEPRTTERQFILVLPNGTPDAQSRRFWDATPECCNFGATPVDDVGYIASLIRESLQLYAVDPERIRLAGHSNGGYMSYRYACEQPIPVDRVVVLAGSTFVDAAACRNPRPIDVLHMHGTLDDTILYAPNLPPDGNPSKVVTIGAEATVDFWSQVAGCGDTPELIDRRDHHRLVNIAGDPAETEVFRYSDCDAGNVIELWRAVGGDHLYFPVNDLWRDEVAAFLSE